MASAKIIIDKRTFKMKIDMVGYEGSKCIEDINELQKLLNATTLSEDLKPEYVSLVGGSNLAINNKS